MNLDFERIARELMRALRGRRSQPALSRRLGFRTNVAYAWESGRNFPTAATFLYVATRTGCDVRAALEAFYRFAPDWLNAEKDLASPAGVRLLLQDLLAGQPVVEVARAIGRSRFATARWLSGATEPRLPDFLRLIQALTLRVLDFVSVFVDPSVMASIAPAWQRLEAARRIAYEEPFAHAVLRAIELESYQRLNRHEAGFLARQLGITEEEEARYLRLLRDSGQIEHRQRRFRSTGEATVDTRRDPEQAEKLRRFWAQTAIERAGKHAEDVLSFNIFTLAHADLERVRELHRRYFAELRAIAGQSEPAQALLLANVQLVRLA